MTRLHSGSLADCLHPNRGGLAPFRFVRPRRSRDSSGSAPTPYFGYFAGKMSVGESTRRIATAAGKSWRWRQPIVRTRLCSDQRWPYFSPGTKGLGPAELLTRMSAEVGCPRSRSHDDIVLNVMADVAGALPPASATSGCADGGGQSCLAAGPCGRLAGLPSVVAPKPMPS